MPTGSGSAAITSSGAPTSRSVACRQSPACTGRGGPPLPTTRTRDHRPHRQLRAPAGGRDPGRPWRRVVEAAVSSWWASAHGVLVRSTPQYVPKICAKGSARPSRTRCPRSPAVRTSREYAARVREAAAGSASTSADADASSAPRESRFRTGSPHGGSRSCPGSRRGRARRNIQAAASPRRCRTRPLLADPDDGGIDEPLAQIPMVVRLRHASSVAQNLTAFRSSPHDDPNIVQMTYPEDHMTTSATTRPALADPPPTVFERLGEFIVRRARLVLVLFFGGVVLAGVVGSQVFAALGSAGYNDPGSDSARPRRSCPRSSRPPADPRDGPDLTGRRRRPGRDHRRPHARRRDQRDPRCRPGRELLDLSTPPPCAARTARSAR